MSLDVTAEIRIARRRDAVAAFAMEAENDPRWIGGISEVRRLTDPPTGPGTRVERVASFLGRRIEYVMEVVSYEPPARIELRSVKGPFPMVVTYEFDERGEATLARVRVRGSSDGFYRVTGPLLARAVGRSIARDVRNLRALLEAGGDGAAG
ncbi:MAG: SRPBCC family protein [Actinomycetota bacterium]